MHMLIYLQTILITVKQICLFFDIPEFNVLLYRIKISTSSAMFSSTAAHQCDSLHAVVCKTCGHICLFLIIHLVILTILAKIKHSSIAHYFGNTARQKLISCGGKLTNPRLTFWYFYYPGPMFKASFRKPPPAQ